MVATARNICFSGRRVVRRYGRYGSRSDCTYNLNSDTAGYGLRQEARFGYALITEAVIKVK